MEPSEDSGPPRPGSAWRTYALTTAAVTATAAVGAKAVSSDSSWYRGLDRPSWQPPPWAFGPAWTALYASIAWAGGRALHRAQGTDRRRLAVSLGTNLVLNAGWNWMFFGCRSVRAGVLGTVLLDASNADLIRRTAGTDRAAAGALLPYAAWCGFATALNTALARRNPR